MSSSDYEYSDESDDEYGEITMAGWGAQTNANGTTEVNPLPKGGLNGGKKKKKKKGRGGPPPPPPRMTAPRMTAPRMTAPRMTAPSRAVPPVINRGRPPIQPGASAWATGSLVETPFWEQPNGSAASKYADPAPRQQPTWSQQQAAQPPAQPPAQQPTWSQPQPQQQQRQPTWDQQPQPQQQQRQQQQHTWSQQSPQQQQQALLGTSASKYATPAQDQSFTQPPPPPQPQPQQSFAVNTDKPSVIFNIQLAPGVTAALPVFANDNPIDVVNGFERKHQLVMSKEAKELFAQKVVLMLQQSSHH
ncbi:unnamed protein product [Rhizopus stolonifer]